MALLYHDFDDRDFDDLRMLLHLDYDALITTTMILMMVMLGLPEAYIYKCGKIEMPFGTEHLCNKSLVHFSCCELFAECR